MKIKKLVIKNYKSIKFLEISDFRSLNIFIGKNDAGKSNIIGALDILFNSNLQDYNGILKLIEENVLESVFGTSSKYHFFDKKNPVAEITVYIDISSRELEKHELKPEKEANKLVISKKVIGGKKTTIVSLGFLRVNKNVVIKTPEEKNRFLTKNGSYSEKFDDCVGKGLLESLSNEFILIPADRNIIRDPHPGSEKVRVEKYIKDSLISLANSPDEDKKKLFSQFIDFIDEISPLIESVEPVVENKRVVDLEFKTGLGENIPLSTIGGGNNELLLLLHEMIVSGGLIMAIEEPEIHLHPQAERKLYRFMEEFSQTTQMFVVTHSPVFVEPGNLRGLFRVAKDNSGTMMYAMDEKDYIDRDRLEQELNTENCEMFFADRVLLVEGISDKIFMEGLIDRYCKSTEEIKVVSSFSKDNFDVYVDLLRIFKIPFLVMTDLDALKGRFQTKIIWRELKKHRKIKGRDERIAFLKTHGIHVLSKGALESCYPREYRRGISKPLDALYAIHNLTDEDYYSSRMTDLKGVIEALER